MPGLFGIWLKPGGRIDPRSLPSMARRMADTMRTVPWLGVDLWGTDSYCGGRVHLGVLNPMPQPLISQDGSRYAWFDGHYFATSTASEHVTPTADEIAALFDDPSTLARRVDGVFNMACFNADTQELLLGNDRLGFRPFYYTETPDWFAYAAEVKALLAIRDVLPDLDEVSLRQFFSMNRMLDKRTWWKGITLMPPATVWRLSAEGISRRRYWAFDELPVRQVELSEAQEEFGRLWALEVRRHSKPTLPILLSGGLDSRLLLAELLAQGVEVVAVSYGSRESPELNRARQVTRIAGVPHRVCLLDTKNWWHRRDEGIWYTDGLVNANHLNCAITMDTMHSGSWYSAVNIAGDLLFGGSHLDNYFVPPDWGPESVERWLNHSYMANPFVSRDEFVACSLEEAADCAGGPSSDCIYLRTEYRRYTLYFPVSLMTHCEFGFPGLGQDTLKLFLGGVPASARRGSKFYNDFLVGRYPKYYLNIPWERSGRGLVETAPVRAWRNTRSQMRHVLRRAGRRIGRQLPPGLQSRARSWVAESDTERVPMTRWFVDFHRCVSESRVRERLLQGQLVIDGVLRGAVRRVLSDNHPRIVTPRLLIAILTVETYLRQVAGMVGANQLWLGSGDQDVQVDRNGSLVF